jgi:hypothetical protein
MNCSSIAGVVGRLGSVVILVGAFAGPGTALGQTTIAVWNCSTGNWSTASCWSTGGAPSLTDAVQIQGGSSNVQITGGSAQALSVDVD